MGIHHTHYTVASGLALLMLVRPHKTKPAPLPCTDRARSTYKPNIKRKHTYMFPKQC